ncbi:hypothetical protein HELRODRAFT_173150 [Helobdella robusta]|uniref:Uncharacterized protein n=1 Tax=Helobdella robusta TaxID=6412 RepID=T1F6G4_HELRO|nr:hypothetical protein HELRODRAFT_173150 [Helobdella robusta]ESO04073.1 hypothetical protein HELRODRAFT_173150 [Helobdella robusta]
MAPASEDTVNFLIEKHPKTPIDRAPSSPKEDSGISVTSQQILTCLRSFPKVRVFQRAAIPVIKEPAGLLEKGNYRPDRCSGSLGQRRSLTWDVTFSHKMAERQTSFMSTEAGTAAIKASDQKTIKYATLNDSTKMFTPVCIETFGPTDGQTQTFINQLIAKVVEISGNPENKRYIKQYISILLQRFKAFCIMEGATKYLSVQEPQT